MNVLGLMSGTSLDGIDAALLRLGARTSPFSMDWELLGFQTRPYEPAQRTVIEAAIAGGGAHDLALLHVNLGEWFAHAALDLLQGLGVRADDVHAIGSHGQTIWHEPPRAGARGASLQLGCPATLAERTGIGVVSDFRARDLAAGGHGAPLVPWADRVFFSSLEGPRALQNLGGMANVTWLPQAGKDGDLLAFDTGPGVALLNCAAHLASGGTRSFDENGNLAFRGTVSQVLLHRLLSHPFFSESPPRSTGRETFGPDLVKDAVAVLEGERAQKLVPGAELEGWPDLLATFTAFTARSIGDAYRRWVLPRGVEEVFLMGGGAGNPALVQAIEKELAPVAVRLGGALGMDPDAREAAAFALLAWAHLKGIPANVPEATGSWGPRVLGSWTPGGRRMSMGEKGPDHEA